MNQQAYDAFSSDYDKFVNWTDRLNFELPFIEAQIKQLGSKIKVLDTACGTGMHAIALAQRGYEVVGADVSGGMINQARINAEVAGVEVRFEQSGFGELTRTFGVEAFDAILCLGNSLSHVLDEQDLSHTLDDFARCLKSGGMVMIQNRNFDAVMAGKERWMEPQAYQDGTREWLFLRFYDYLANGKINFNIVTLRKEDGRWLQSVASTVLQPLLQNELNTALEKVDFEKIQSYGDMTGKNFDRSTSGNLVMIAVKRRIR